MVHFQRYSPPCSPIDFFMNLDLNYFSFVNHFHSVIPKPIVTSAKSSAIKGLIRVGQIESILGAIWGFLKAVATKFVVETLHCTFLIHCKNFIILFRTLAPKSVKLC